MNWRIGNGPTFQGVFELRKQQVLRFERTQHGASIAPVQAGGPDDPALEAEIGPTAWHDLRDAAELLSGAGAAFNHEDFLRGAVIPVYFGVALTTSRMQPLPPRL